MFPEGCSLGLGDFPRANRLYLPLPHISHLRPQTWPLSPPARHTLSWASVRLGSSIQPFLPGAHWRPRSACTEAAVPRLQQNHSCGCLQVWACLGFTRKKNAPALCNECSLSWELWQAKPVWVRVTGDPGTCLLTLYPFKIVVSEINTLEVENLENMHDKRKNEDDP